MNTLWRTEGGDELTEGITDVFDPSKKYDPDLVKRIKARYKDMTGLHLALDSERTAILDQKILLWTKPVAPKALEHIHWLNAWESGKSGVFGELLDRTRTFRSDLALWGELLGWISDHPMPAPDCPNCGYVMFLKNEGYKCLNCGVRSYA